MGIQGKKPLAALAGTCVFGVVLLCIYYVHVRFFKVDVVFFGALFDAAAAVILTGGVLWMFGFLSGFNPFERSQLLMVWLLLGYIYAISVPTVIDRSLSFYILEKMQQRGGAIRLDKFEDVFTREYLKEHQLVAVRLTEQMQSGTVVIEQGCARLTERGRRLATFSRYFRIHFLPKRRLLMGRYTDELTDPFRHSSEGSADGCQ